MWPTNPNIANISLVRRWNIAGTSPKHRQLRGTEDVLLRDFRKRHCQAQNTTVRLCFCHVHVYVYVDVLFIFICFMIYAQTII